MKHHTSIAKKIAAFSLAAVSSATLLTAPMATNTALFRNFCITASASSDKFNEDTVVLANGEFGYASGSNVQSWFSKNKRFKLIFQTDGNLVLYDQSNSNRVVWKSGTGIGNSYNTRSFQMKMQADGNFVVYSQARYARSLQALWQAHTVASGGTSCTLRLSNDGELYVYHSGRQQSLWSSRSEIECTAKSNTCLNTSQCLSSKNRLFRAVMQSDGNFVVYDKRSGSDKAIFNTRTQGNSGAFFALQQDGNLVVYSSARKPLYSTGTCSSPYADYKLSLGDDGVLTLTRKNTQTVIWSSASRFNLDLIKQVGCQPSGSVSCSCYALAYATTLLDGRAHNWYEYNLYGNSSSVCAIWSKGGFHVEQKYSRADGYKLMYDQIKAGKPCVILVAGPRSSQHYITVIDVNSNADRNNLSTKDFTILDPAPVNGRTAPVAEKMSDAGYDLKYDYYDFPGYNINIKN